MYLWLDKRLAGAVLDVDAVDGKPGDVVGDLVRIVSVAVLDVHAEVALESSQPGGQAQVGLLRRPAPVGPAEAARDAEARRADGGEAALQQCQRRRHVPCVGQQQWQFSAMKVGKGHSSLHGVTGLSRRIPSTITSRRSSKKQIQSRTGSASCSGS